MTFGSNPADIIIVLEFTRRLYRQCKNADDAYFEIGREIRALHTVLRHLKYEVQAPESILNRDRALYARDLAPLISDCRFTLEDLEELLRKYGDIKNNDRGGSTTGRLWNQFKFGSIEMDQLGTVRVKLINHKTNITALLDTIQLHESSRVAMTLDNHGGQLDIILDKVDNIASRMGQRAASLMTTYEDDDKEVWKSFRRELVAEGFSSDVLTRHKDVLRAYIRQIDQNGLLEDIPVAAKARQPVLSVNTQEWLEQVQSPASASGPPSFNTTSSDSSIKELRVGEDNSKFLQTMKNERPKPESITTGWKEGIGDTKAPPVQPLPPQVPILYAPPVQPPPVPALQRSGSSNSRNGYGYAVAASPPTSVQLRSPIPEPEICTTESILADDSANESRIRMLEAPRADGRPRRQSDQNDRDQGNSPQGSPASSKSASSFTDANAMAYRPRPQQLPVPVPEGSLYSASPRGSGALPIPVRAASHHPTDRYGHSPRNITTSVPAGLAPDSQGREIPRDAKWTKIRRRLVSTEILEEDRLRYEARPEYVAILGVFSRSQIQDLAIRTAALRESRRLRSQSTRAPRPADPIPAPAPPKKSVHFPDEDTRISDTSDESSSTRSSADRRYSRDRARRREEDGDRDRDRPQFAPRKQGQYRMPQSWMESSSGAVSSEGRERKGREREGREIGGAVKGGAAKGSRGSQNKRWSERFTAASIGGAAGSLLSVLSEAAQDISL
ncbi:hypothetical protein VE01_01773 [Pseudogymnoascus verrucosus]|uniref:DUF8035 domain-containing protein n=1 Tax=Pseudogymnoascus verrucosus TaxID=342668 RepID=A0A1B8GW43_9PEZI|nr:uncharacterized protein VE01_01773 [Pseudogymnoascus verrucosus]OBU00058.1 hypothetical protein VE01_01773 [Pseudogymnoascus verrucosus]